MNAGYIAIEDYIRDYEPYYGDEVKSQSEELSPWIEEREKDLGLAASWDEAGKRVFQKGLVAWAFSRVG